MLANSFVDSHMHIFDANQGLDSARYRPTYSATFSQWIVNAQPLAVQRAVLVQTSFMGVDYGLILDTLRRHPEHSRAVLVIPPTTSRAELETLRQLGLRGVRLNLVGTDHNIQTWVAQTKFIESLIEFDLHCELHTDHGRLPEVLLQLPQQLKIVIDHMGKPSNSSPSDLTFSTVRRRVKSNNDDVSIYVKLSAPYRLNGGDPATIARRWFDTLGPNQLLWGSDWPCTTYEAHADYSQLFNNLSIWLNDDQAVLRALTSNPNRLYWAK